MKFFCDRSLCLFGATMVVLLLINTILFPRFEAVIFLSRILLAHLRVEFITDFIERMFLSVVRTTTTLTRLI